MNADELDQKWRDDWEACRLPWMRGDEYRAKRVLSAFNRFMNEPGMTPGVAALLTQAWATSRPLQGYSDDDRREFRA